ncbi:MAG: hypothetical protein FWH10_05455 [Oscillospiraceae bacterium]|nr:hypothetical protein [Oscillospiraceae bacterium]
MKFTNKFYNSETLLRGVPNIPNFWDDELNRPTSAAFKDPRGLSVNRTDENKRCYDESLDQLKTSERVNRFKAIAEVSVEFCRSLGLCLKYEPTEDNIYHSEIHKSEHERKLSKSEARKLATECLIVS